MRALWNSQSEDMTSRTELLNMQIKRIENQKVFSPRRLHCPAGFRLVKDISGILLDFTLRITKIISIVAMKPIIMEPGS